MRKITFKLIEIEALNEVLHLFNKAAEKINRLNIDHWQYWKNPPQEKIKWVEAGLNNKEFFFVHGINGEKLGMFRLMKQDLMYWGIQKAKARYIHSLVVVDKHNGKGIGEKIIQKIENHAKDDNCRYIRLDADSKNKKLCNYYGKLGFKKVGSKTLPISTYNLYEKELDN